MRLHEEFKEYETMWEDLEQDSELVYLYLTPERYEQVGAKLQKKVAELAGVDQIDVTVLTVQSAFVGCVRSNKIKAYTDKESAEALKQKLANLDKALVKKLFDAITIIDE